MFWVPLMKCILVFLAKINWQAGCLDLLVGGRSDLRRSLFFLISHYLCLWQQIVLLWIPKLPAIHWCWMLAINILMPSFSSPWSYSPCWSDKKEKPGKIFAPDQVINRKKEPVRTTNSTGHNQPTMVNTKLTDNALKTVSFRLNKHTKQVNDMSNTWITKHS